MKPTLRTTENLRGVWPAVLLETTQGDRADLHAIARAVRHYAQARVQGVYTGDTASEFYSLEYDQWDELAGFFRNVTREEQLPAGIGCTWTNQNGALRRVARARELGYDNIHLSVPYWLRLNDAAMRTFWTAVAEAAQDLPIVVYAGSQGQFPLDGTTLLRLREYCPSIVGTKSTGFDAVAMNSLLSICPDLVHFVHEQVLCAWTPLGARGCFSNLAGLGASRMVEWFRLIESGNWAEAFAIQRRVNGFYEEGAVPLRKAGYMVDKPLAAAGGVPGATLDIRPPYPVVPDHLFEGLVRAAHKHLPDFISTNSFAMNVSDPPSAAPGSREPHPSVTVPQNGELTHGR